MSASSLRPGSVPPPGSRSKAAVFYHFANRDELIQEVVNAVAANGAQFMMPRVAAASGPTEQLRAYIEVFFASLVEAPADVRALYVIGQHWTDETGQPRLVNDPELQEAAVAPIVDILRSGQESGEFGEFSARSVALALKAVLDGAIQQFVVFADLDAAEHTRELVALFDRTTRADR